MKGFCERKFGSMFISGTFTNNSSRNGGAILNMDGNIGTITNSEFTNNTALSEETEHPTIAFGGAIARIRGTLGEINNVVFNSNKAITNHGESKGGAIYLESQTNAQITDSSFSGNKADLGGAIYAENSNVIISAATKNVEFSNNVNYIYTKFK